MTKNEIRLGYLFIFLGSIFPIFPSLLGSLLLWMFNGDSHSGFEFTCSAFGHEIGGFIGMLYFLMWLSMFTLPLGGIAFIAFFVYHLFFWKEKRY